MRDVLDLVVRDLEGHPTCLRTYTGKPVLLVFLRWLGWIPCREHITQLRDQKHLLDELRVTVLVISFESPATLQRFRWFRDLSFVMLSDPSRHLYKAFGFRSRPFRSLFDRGTLMSYLRGFLSGRAPRLRHADMRQLGGDVVLNSVGKAVFVHRSKTPADRPPVDELLRVLRAAAE